MFPRYWGLWIGIGFLSLFCLFPLKARWAFGETLGILGFIVTGKRRRIVRENIRACFPDLTEKELSEKVFENFKSSGIAILETFEAWFFPKRDFESLVRFEGLELLKSAKNEGRGVILLGVHLCALDLCGAALSRKIPFHVMYKRNRNLLINTIMTQGREKNFESTVERRKIRDVIKILKSGSILWYGPDQDYGKKHSIFAPFFGVPAATITATSRIAHSTKSQLIFMSQYRDRENGKYLVRLERISSAFPSNDMLVDCKLVNKKIEEAILFAPEQYWWLHRRFKTRPSEEPSLY